MKTWTLLQIPAGWIVDRFGVRMPYAIGFAFWSVISAGTALLGSTTQLVAGRVMLGGWSAGCGAIRQILKSPDSYARVEAALMVDGIHSDYVDGKPGPLESRIGGENLEIWQQLARDAIAGRKRAIVTHSEIFPGTFASTTD